jgi:hypothetical protein
MVEERSATTALEMRLKCKFLLQFLASLGGERNLKNEYTSLPFRIRARHKTIVFPSDVHQLIKIYGYTPGPYLSTD